MTHKAIMKCGFKFHRAKNSVSALKLHHVTHLPPPCIVRSAAIGQGHSDGPCVVSQHPVGHVDPVSVLCTHFPSVWPSTCALQIKTRRQLIGKWPFWCCLTLEGSRGLRGGGGGTRRKGDHLARSCNPKKGDRGKTEEPLTRLLHSVNHNALCFFRTLLLILTMKLADGHRCPHVAKHTTVSFLTELTASLETSTEVCNRTSTFWMASK